MGNDTGRTLKDIQTCQLVFLHTSLVRGKMALMKGRGVALIKREYIQLIHTASAVPGGSCSQLIDGSGNWSDPPPQSVERPPPPPAPVNPAVYANQVRLSTDRSVPRGDSCLSVLWSCVDTVTTPPQVCWPSYWGGTMTKNKEFPCSFVSCSTSISFNIESAVEADKYQTT